MIIPESERSKAPLVGEKVLSHPTFQRRRSKRYVKSPDKTDDLGLSEGSSVDDMTTRKVNAPS
jgi:hypothetical protein